MFLCYSRVAQHSRVKEVPERPVAVLFRFLREEVRDPPPLRTVDDIENILKDSDKLEKCSAHIFNICDDDCSGLVTRDVCSAQLCSLCSWIRGSTRHAEECFL